MVAKRVTRTRHVNMVKMKRALIWLEDYISKKIPVCGNLIKQKALKIYGHFNPFTSSAATTTGYGRPIYPAFK